jgi:hypothetical protein
LVDRFLATAESVLNRVDDSGGAVGEIYRQAVLLWLTAAKGWQDANVDCLERIYQLYQQNDYGVLDPLLPNANLLLTPDQLKQLAWRYENALRTALKSPEQEDKLNLAALRSGVALGQIADALRDPALYERSVSIHSPQPNNLQMRSICEKYLQHEQPETAMRYLNQAWEDRFERDRLVLLDSVIKPQPDGESSGLLVLARHQELAECFYDSLLRLAKAFEKAVCNLAATACYRALLLDILAQARSRACGHGARYYEKLEALAKRSNEFKPLPTHNAFVQQLHSAHGRKKVFGRDWNHDMPKPAAQHGVASRHFR